MSREKMEARDERKEDKVAASVLSRCGEQYLPQFLAGVWLLLHCSHGHNALSGVYLMMDNVTLQVLKCILA
jgi:hypothetical protein